MKKLRNILCGLLAFFFASTLLVVALYRVLPVWATPLMFIRAAEGIGGDGPVTWHHTWTPLSEMSPSLPVAVMASEDQRFLMHSGFDFDAIEKAARHNMHSKRKFGASTISQQTAKNVFLWPGRSWVRKGLEVYFTWLIELMWGKERIMEVYLNSIEMGPGIYGAEAVAEEHFDKTAAQLSRADCALVAATLPNPRKFSSKDPSPYMRQRQRTIERMMRTVPAFNPDNK